MRHELVNHNVRTLWFEPKSHLGYTAGQFIEATIPHNHPDDRGIKRWFTLSSAPSDKLLSITTKFAEHTSTFKHALLALQPGDEIEFSEAMGDFVLPKDPSIPLVFVAGGIGITPFHSIVNQLLASSEKRTLQVILAASTPDDFVFVDLFRSYGVEPICIVSEPRGGWRGDTGKLDGGRVLDLIGGSMDKRIYMSGPEQLVEVLDEQLKALGVDETQLVGDFFPGYTAGI
jgi:ferredoxin-NADP reductase